MNIKKIACGFESGSDHLLRYLKGHYIKVDDNQQAMDLCYQHGLQIAGNYILGSPPETLKDLHQTYWHVRKNREKLRGVYFCHTTPLPKTPWWQEALRQGLFQPKTVNYDALKVYYAKGQSYFMNLHYSEEIYQEIYETFKYLEQAIEQDIPTPDYGQELWNTLQPLLKGSLLWLSFKTPPENLWNYADVSRVAQPKQCYQTIVLDSYLSLYSKPALLLEELQSTLSPDGSLLIYEDNPFYPPFIWCLLNNTAASLPSRWTPEYFRNQIAHDSYELKQFHGIEASDNKQLISQFGQILPTQFIHRYGNYRGFLAHLRFS